MLDHRSPQGGQRGRPRLDRRPDLGQVAQDLQGNLAKTAGYRSRSRDSRRNP
ncbi:hypothetical protein ACIBO5_52630 [Nonomuraea angiospora]|uniref:hypothetical protein n=1 Tax=Nonomuraea angiospora TaxID=46172 RepID=UPI0037B18ABB